jgi:hypothetical protein
MQIAGVDDAVDALAIIQERKFRGKAGADTKQILVFIEGPI